MQKDYVQQGCITSNKNKLAGNKKTKRGLSNITLIFFIFIIFIFISILFFITKNEKMSFFNRKILPSRVELINSLPSKSEERWRYIKELENMGTDQKNFKNSI
ncbi:MAG: hypothetical protein P6H82_03375 [Candidatus Arsenophonus melophagi]|nr:hypothetical protein [Candidatus Arsenophonus melophagi]